MNRAEYGPNSGPNNLRFNPSGALIRVASEAAPILGGQSALLTQAADPRVGELLVHTGEIQRNTLGRLRLNATLGFDIIHGTNAEAEEALTRINNVHANPNFRRKLTTTTGAHQEGKSYSPMTQEAQGVVAGTLIVGSVEGYQRFVGPLSDSERNEYAKDAVSGVFAPMGLKPKTLPETYDGIQIHLETMIYDGRLAVGDAAMSLMPYILLEHASVPRAIKNFMRLQALDMLHPELMRQYGLKITTGERKTARRRADDIKKALPHMPDFMRHNPQFLTERRRANGDTITPWQTQHPRLYSILTSLRP
ncbi:MAG: DUF2236 domain-containing protein [Candidatus Levybacteria bacterium]|nr:DUF2236 domain-containing protein [Candidatus Levybacteria bacterium]